MQIYLEKAKLVGFETAAECDPRGLVFLPEVRGMCASGRCNMYGKNWACPPACGSIEYWHGRAAEYSRGVLVQTIGAVEDSFDFEGMEEVQATHKRRVFALADVLKAEFPEVLVMAAGACNVCETCTCPDSPCRFPEKRFSSMEACGLMVSDVCRACGLKYTNGENTVTFISLYLF